jgi:cytochrome P450
MDTNTITTAPSSVSYPFDDPYPWYKSLNDKSPLSRISPGQWMVTGYDEALFFLQSPDCSHWGQDIESQSMMTPVQKAIAKTLHALAPGNDLLYRKTIMHQLAGKNLKIEDTYIQDVSDRILKRIKSDATIELMSTYAHPFTFHVISRMIGVPEDKISALSNHIEKLNGSYLDYMSGSRENQDVYFLKFLEELISEKSKKPENDLCSLLVNASRQNNEEPFFTISMLILLFYAGHENMMNFIGNAVIALHNNPMLQKQLRANPEVITDFIDELLRFDSPLQFIVLFTKEDIERHGKFIPAGSQVLVGVGAANRDPKVFENPDQLEFTRKPNHLSFGAGAFRCIGSKLARLEGAIAIRSLLTNSSSFDFTTQNITWRKGNFVQRGPLSLTLNIMWND